MTVPSLKGKKVNTLKNRSVTLPGHLWEAARVRGPPKLLGRCKHRVENPLMKRSKGTKL